MVATEDLLGVAVAIELLHNAFLVHDDIADGSSCVGARHIADGLRTAVALNAGDTLAVLAGQVVRRTRVDQYDESLADRVATEFETMMLRTLEGQATEVGLAQSDAVVGAWTPEDYLDLIMHKTCWYTTIHPLRVGALVGSAGAVDVRPHRIRFGFYLGAAFQIPRRSAEPGRGRADLRQGDPGRPVRGQADVAADPPAGDARGCEWRAPATRSSAASRGSATEGATCTRHDGLLRGRSTTTLSSAEDSAGGGGVLRTGFCRCRTGTTSASSARRCAVRAGAVALVAADSDRRRSDEPPVP